jgi:hypothetical protein
MNTETKTLLGKLLGEIFRIQKRTGVPTYSDATVYGLLNGLEPAIDHVIGELDFVSTELVDRAAKILQPIFDDPAMLAAFNGFYDIEQKLQEAGIDRGTAIRIFHYFHGSGMYMEVLAKMDSTGSPTECRTFDIDDSDV